MNSDLDSERASRLQNVTKITGKLRWMSGAKEKLQTLGNKYLLSKQLEECMKDMSPLVRNFLTGSSMTYRVVVPNKHNNESFYELLTSTTYNPDIVTMPAGRRKALYSLLKIWSADIWKPLFEHHETMVQLRGWLYRMCTDSDPFPTCCTALLPKQGDVLINPYSLLILCHKLEQWYDIQAQFWYFDTSPKWLPSWLLGRVLRGSNGDESDAQHSKPSLRVMELVMDMTFLSKMDEQELGFKTPLVKYPFRFSKEDIYKNFDVTRIAYGCKEPGVCEFFTVAGIFMPLYSSSFPTQFKMPDAPHSAFFDLHSLYEQITAYEDTVQTVRAANPDDWPYAVTLTRLLTSGMVGELYADPDKPPPQSLLYMLLLLITGTLPQDEEDVAQQILYSMIHSYDKARDADEPLAAEDAYQQIIEMSQTLQQNTDTMFSGSTGESAPYSVFRVTMKHRNTALLPLAGDNHTFVLPPQANLRLNMLIAEQDETELIHGIKLNMWVPYFEFAMGFNRESQWSEIHIWQSTDANYRSKWEFEPTNLQTNGARLMDVSQTEYILEEIKPACNFFSSDQTGKSAGAGLNWLQVASDAPSTGASVGYGVPMSFCNIKADTKDPTEQLMIEGIQGLITVQGVKVLEATLLFDPAKQKSINEAMLKTGLKQGASHWRLAFHGTTVHEAIEGIIKKGILRPVLDSHLEMVQSSYRRSLNGTAHGRGAYGDCTGGQQVGGIKSTGYSDIGLNDPDGKRYQVGFLYGFIVDKQTKTVGPGIEWLVSASEQHVIPLAVVQYVKQGSRFDPNISQDSYYKRYLEPMFNGSTQGDFAAPVSHIGTASGSCRDILEMPWVMLGAYMFPRGNNIYTLGPGLYTHCLENFGGQLPPISAIVNPCSIESGHIEAGQNVKPLAWQGWTKKILKQIENGCTHSLCFDAGDPLNLTEKALLAEGFLIDNRTEMQKALFADSDDDEDSDDMPIDQSGLPKNVTVVPSYGSPPASPTLQANAMSSPPPAPVKGNAPAPYNKPAPRKLPAAFSQSSVNNTNAIDENRRQYRNWQFRNRKWLKTANDYRQNPDGSDKIPTFLSSTCCKRPEFFKVVTSIRNDPQLWKRPITLDIRKHLQWDNTNKYGQRKRGAINYSEKMEALWIKTANDVNNKLKQQDPTYKYSNIIKLPDYARHDYERALNTVSNTPYLTHDPYNPDFRVDVPVNGLTLQQCQTLAKKRPRSPSPSTPKSPRAAPPGYVGTQARKKTNRRSTGSQKPPASPTISPVASPTKVAASPTPPTGFSPVASQSQGKPPASPTFQGVTPTHSPRPSSPATPTAGPSPTYSPTSPQYTRTSPGYTPMSPIYNPQSASGSQSSGNSSTQSSDSTYKP